MNHNIALAAERGGHSLTWEQRKVEIARELAMPWQARVYVDGAPPWLVCGETEASVLARIRPARKGPNGPVDSYEWVRRPKWRGCNEHHSHPDLTCGDCRGRSLVGEAP